ncbi:MAG: hypothetical protein H6Q00_1394 [Holophagaceae bacterium]|nr:hypothetical protein [Holophagaceae bacterium]
MSKPNLTVMEYRLILDMMAKSLYAIREARGNLDIQIADLEKQSEWIKGQIREAMEGGKTK